MLIERRKLLWTAVTGVLFGLNARTEAGGRQSPKGTKAVSAMANSSEKNTVSRCADLDVPGKGVAASTQRQAELFVRDYGAIGDGTLRTVADWIDPESPTKRKYQSLSDLQVDYPHILSINDSLDWAAIQKAIDTGRNVGFHDGAYRIGANQLVMSQSGQSLYALNGSRGGALNDPSTGGAFIVFEALSRNDSQAALLCKGSLQRIIGMKFRGDIASKNNIAILAKKNNNNDDLDIEVLDCQFNNVYAGIHCYGRGAHVSDCLFSNNKSGFCITSDWPSSGTSGSGGQTDAMYKGRALRITNNRCHGSGTLLRIRNYIARSPIISSNVIDFGNQLLSVETDFATGGVLYADLTSNIADLCGKTIISFGPGTRCIGLNINGGSYGGAAAGSVDGADHRPFAILGFDGCAEVDGVSLTGVNLHDTDGYIFQFNNSTGVKAIVPKNISVKGGQIRGFGQKGGAVRGIVSTVYDIHGLSLDPGSISDPGPNATALIQSAGSKTISGLFLGGAVARSGVTTFSDTNVSGVVEGVERLSSGHQRRYKGAANLWE